MLHGSVIWPPIDPMKRFASHHFRINTYVIFGKDMAAAISNVSNSCRNRSQPKTHMLIAIEQPLQPAPGRLHLATSKEAPSMCPWTNICYFSFDVICDWSNLCRHHQKSCAAICCDLWHCSLRVPWLDSPSSTIDSFGFGLPSLCTVPKKLRCWVGEGGIAVAKQSQILARLKRGWERSLTTTIHI